MENKEILLKVVHPVHVSDANGRIPAGFWRIKNGKVTVLDLDKLAEKYSLKQLRDLFSQAFRGYSPFSDNDYTVPPNAPSVSGTRPRGDIIFFIRDGNGNVYLPGSSIKGCIRTAIIGAAIENNVGALQNLLSYVYSGRYDKKHGFSKWYQRTVGSPHADPFRALSVGDAGTSVTTELLETLRVSTGRTIPSGYHEYAVDGEFLVRIGFDSGLWDDLARGTFLDNLQISSIDDILRIWTEWNAKVLQWVSQHYDGLGVVFPRGDKLVFVGRNAGWATKTVGYLLRDQPRPGLFGHGRRAQCWPLPCTVPAAVRSGQKFFPGALELV
ncbi:MAG: CRISPR-associated protein Csm5 [Candidatus Diapherotrites archaeon]|nr:CRISPR-associated protein Csm5 [Candidatus Diapherotrites archaeon]MDN5366830.1 CRISPR-associated protein Csm5 [Candidatus Diapherotrites archaeon]